MPKAGEGVENSEPSCTAGGKGNDAVPMENSTAVPPRIKHRVAKRSRNSTSGLTPQRNESRKSNMYVFAHPGSQQHHSQQSEVEQPECPPRLNGLTKWAMCAAGYSSAAKRREVLTRATARTSLEDTRRREARQAEKSRPRDPTSMRPLQSSVSETGRRLQVAKELRGVSIFFLKILFTYF